MPNQVKGGWAKHSNPTASRVDYRVLSDREILQLDLPVPDFFRVEIHGQSQTASHRYVETFETCTPLMAVGAAVVEFLGRGVAVRIDRLFVLRRKQSKR